MKIPIFILFILSLLLFPNEIIINSFEFQRSFRTSQRIFSSGKEIQLKAEICNSLKSFLSKGVIVSIVFSSLKLSKAENSIDIEASLAGFSKTYNGSIPMNEETSEKIIRVDTLQDYLAKPSKCSDDCGGHASTGF